MPASMKAKSVVDAVKARLKDNQEARRALDKDVAVYQGRLTKFKDQLSLVKTNKEYQAMQHEIATAQSDLGAVEEKVLERMLEADAIAADSQARGSGARGAAERDRRREEGPRRGAHLGRSVADQGHRGTSARSSRISSRA